jgi:1-aminocyclopropane-1-carboxylate deaminase
VKRVITDGDITLVEDYAFPAYGIPSPETLEAIRLAARLEGLVTDPVYEGKSMQAMIEMVKAGYFPAGTRLLYAHLGGVPALSGYSYAFREG